MAGGGLPTDGLTRVGTAAMTQAIVDRIAIGRAAPEAVAAREHEPSADTAQEPAP